MGVANATKGVKHGLYTEPLSDGSQLMSDKLVDVLSNHMPEKDATEIAAALTDLRDGADLISTHITRLETSEDLRGDIAAIMTQLESLDWESQWLLTNGQRLWRRVTGSSWRSAREELKLTAKSIGSWWGPEGTVDEATQRIVALRKAARQLSVELHPYELLAMGKSSSASAAKGRVRRLVDGTRASAETLGNLLSRGERRRP